MSWKRLEAFLNGVAAASELYGKAARNGSIIETVCLAANLIDAKLRIGIILARQLERGDKSIDVDLLLQTPTDRPIFEKEIYAIARKEGVIYASLEQELRRVYDDRNRVIHRYIITDITTDDVLAIGIAYEHAIEEVRRAIWTLERKQIDLGVGMTIEVPDMQNAEAKQLFRIMASQKHRKDWPRTRD